jgi:hypothetical protein
MSAIEPSTIEDEISAEDFVALCRAEERMFPKPNINDIAPPRRIVSRDFLAGCTDGGPFDVFTPAFLRRQAD